jgi:hypothetical protein
MAIDAERTEVADGEPAATADGGLCRLDLPGEDRSDTEERAEDEAS